MLYVFNLNKCKWRPNRWESFRVGVHVMTPLFYLGPYVLARKRR